MTKQELKYEAMLLVMDSHIAGEIISLAEKYAHEVSMEAVKRAQVSILDSLQRLSWPLEGDPETICLGAKEIELMKQALTPTKEKSFQREQLDTYLALPHEEQIAIGKELFPPKEEQNG